jgi:DNA-binding transcriptional LysR family regulator
VLDFRRLVTFRQAALRGSFAAAADALSFTPSAVSQQMSALEREVGAELFERSARGVRLTEAGTVLFQHADVLLARVADAEADLGGIGRSDSVRIGSFSSASAVFSALAVERFRARHPSVALRLFDSEPDESVERLDRGDLDVAVLFGFQHPGPGGRRSTALLARGLDCRWLFGDPYYVVLPDGHRLAPRDSLAVDHLRGEVILGGSMWMHELQRLCGLAGFEPRVDSTCQAIGFEACQAFVAAGRGVTLVPRLELRWLRPDLIARPLGGAPVRHVMAAMPADGSRPPLSGPVVEALEEVVRELRLRRVGSRPPAELVPASRLASVSSLAS